MKDLEEELDLNILSDVFGDFLSPGCELPDLDMASSIIANQAPGPCTEKGGAITMYESSSLSHESMNSEGSKGQEDKAARKRELTRLRQQRHRQKKRELEKTKAEKLEDARNELRRLEEENRKIEQENRAMSSLIETASSMQQKMKLSAVSSISCDLVAPDQYISQRLESMATLHTFDQLADLTYDRFMERFFLTFGAHTIVRTASLFLSSSQLRRILYIPLVRTCRLVMEVGDDAFLYLWKRLFVIPVLRTDNSIHPLKAIFYFTPVV